MMGDRPDGVDSSNNDCKSESTTSAVADASNHAAVSPSDRLRLLFLESEAIQNRMHVEALTAKLQQYRRRLRQATTATATPPGQRTPISKGAPLNDDDTVPIRVAELNHVSHYANTQRSNLPIKY